MKPKVTPRPIAGGKRKPRPGAVKKKPVKPLY